MDSRYDGLKYRQDSDVIIRRNEENARRKRNNIKEGSYGVSIRVQGIDGHPFIVLNNKEGYSSSNIPPPEKECLLQDRSLLNLKNSQNSVRTDDKDFPENPYKLYKSSNNSNYLHSKNSTPESKDGSQKASVLNFQRHPELLKPYNPNENPLNIDHYKSSKNDSGLLTTEEQRKKDSKLFMFLPKDVTSKYVRSKSADIVEQNGKDASSMQEDQIKSPTDNTSMLSSTSDNNTSESFSSSNGSPYSTSSTITAESRRTRPDVLQFKRQDSGQAVDGPRSRRSSCSSATATSSQSLQKLWLEEQEDALYADNVNRHENRRYIPFVPGTGRDIDTGCIPGVDELIEKFDVSVPIQRRGRSAKRNRINPEDRKRARSVDSALPFGLQGNTAYLNEFSRNLGKSNEHLLRPSQICQQKAHMQNYKLPFKRQNTTGSLVSQAAPTDKVQQQNYSSLPYYKETKNSRLTSFSETDSATLQRQNKRNGDVQTMTSSLKLSNYSIAPSEESKRRVKANTHSSGQGAQVSSNIYI